MPSGPAPCRNQATLHPLLRVPRDHDCLTPLRLGGRSTVREGGNGQQHTGLKRRARRDPGSQRGLRSRTKDICECYLPMSTQRTLSQQQGIRIKGRAIISALNAAECIQPTHQRMPSMIPTALIHKPWPRPICRPTAVLFHVPLACSTDEAYCNICSQRVGDNAG
jgi:hypothetical protein